MSTRQEVQRIVREAIDGLGHDPAIVESNLLAAKCYGPRGSCSMCPIAAYVSRALVAAGHAAIKVGVGSSDVIIEERDPVEGESFLERVAMPYPVALFVRRFDAGLIGEALDTVPR